MWKYKVCCYEVPKNVLDIAKDLEFYIANGWQWLETKTLTVKGMAWMVLIFARRETEKCNEINC